MSAPRLLAIMGSGETSPTMVKTHRELFARLGATPSAPVPAVLLDTPFAFQENRTDLAQRAVGYFGESVGVRLDVVTVHDDDTRPALEVEQGRSRLASARFVFAGPGSPTYALRQWSGTVVPALLAEKLRPGGPGGAVVFASAAALTLGVATIPVYEIYKAGEPPRWLPGLDLLTPLGLPVAVIPHYDNAEGGTHDTRFCYLGDRRLTVLEPDLPDGAFVLGIDEHTGLVLDLDAGTAEVTGLGTVTVRRRGRSESVKAGERLSFDDLRALATTGGTAVGAAPAGVQTAAPVESRAHAGHESSPLLAAVARQEAAFAAALDARDADAAVAAVLELEDELHAWSADTLQSEEMDRGRAALRSMVVRLGAAATGGLRDPAEVVGPFVEVLLGQRTAARDAKRWDDADRIRDALTGLGVEIGDSRESTGWRLLS